MKTNLLKGSVSYAAATIFSRVAVIILIPILTRMMPVDEYGAMNIVITVVQLANFIITAEIAQSVTLYYTNSHDANRRYYPSTALWFLVVMYTLLICVIFLLHTFFEGFTGPSPDTPLIYAGAFLLAANGFFQLLQNQLRLEFKSVAYGIFTLSFVILSALGAVLGAGYFPQAAVGVICGQAIGTTIAAICVLVYIKQNFVYGFHKAAFKKMLRYSLPLVPASFFLIGTQQSSKLLLGIFGSMEQAGIFGLAMQIAGFAGLALIGVQTAITPAILAQHALPGTPKKLGGLFEIFFTLSLLFCAALSVFAKEIITVFSTDEYLNASLYVPILAFGIAFNGLYIFFPGKIINGKSSAQLLASTLSFIVSVSTAYILIKTDGVRGAAISTLLAAASFFFCWYSLSQKLYFIPVNWLKILKNSSIIIAISAIVVYYLPSGISLNILIAKLAILIALGFIVSFGYLSKGIKTYIARPKI